MHKGEKVLAHGYGLAHRKDGRAVSPPLYCTPQKIIPLILCLKGIWQVEVCKSVHCSFMWLLGMCLHLQPYESTSFLRAVTLLFYIAKY